VLEDTRADIVFPVIVKLPKCSCVNLDAIAGIAHQTVPGLLRSVWAQDGGQSMRRLMLAALLACTPLMAMADESISGPWQATLGHNVMIAMDVLADGHWSSQTVQNGKVIAEMAGTYQQDKSSDTTGTLVFTPVTSKTSSAHGEAQVETDKYRLESKDNVLRLTSTSNDVMVFHKQPFAGK
jgi:hypothetical protein